MSFGCVSRVPIRLALDTGGLPHGHQDDAKHDGAKEPLCLGPDLAGTEDDVPGNGKAACDAADHPADSAPASDWTEPARGRANVRRQRCRLAIGTNLAAFRWLEVPGGLCWSGHLGLPFARASHNAGSG